MTGRIKITAEEVLDTRVDAELATAARLRSAACSTRPDARRRRSVNRWVLLLLVAVAMAVVACAVALVIAASRRPRPRTPPSGGAQGIVVLSRVAANQQRRDA
jgi:hypothetical protein